MKKITTFLILFIAFCSKIHGQDWVWAKSFQNNDYSLTNTFIDNDKNIYSVGNFDTSTFTIENLQFTNSSGVPPNANVNYTDAYISKHDANGNLIFAKHFTGSKHESFSSITFDGSGNFYATGYYGGDITLGTTTHVAPDLESKSFIAKFDLNGNVIWSKTVNYHGNSLIKYKNGNLYLTGVHSGNTYTYDNLITPSAGYTAVVDSMDKTFVAKLDLSGNAIWLKSSTYNGTASIQNSHRIGTQPKGITVDNNGNVYIAGHFFSNSTTFGSQTLNRNASTNNANLFIAKYDSAGNFGWASTAVTSSASHSTVFDLQADALNNVYLTGTVYNSNANFGGVNSISFIGNTGSYLTKYNSNGIVSWVKGGKISSDTQPNTPLGSNSFYKIYLDMSNNIYISGRFNSYINFGDNNVIQNTGSGSSLFTVKFDQNGFSSNFYKIADAAQSGEIKILDIQGNTFYYSGRMGSLSLTLGDITLQNNNLSRSNFIAKRDISLSTSEFSKSFGIYPNPANSIVTISNLEQDASVNIFDLTGKKVKEVNTNQSSFSVEDLVTGVYVLQIENGANKESIKLVKN